MLKSIMARRREDGFTLTEVLVSMVILGILMAIAVPAYMNQMSTSRETTVKMFITNTTVDLKQERVDSSGSYPARLPAEVVIPKEITDLSYTTSTTRDAYCLAVTYEVRKKSKTVYVRGNEDGTTTQSGTACTFSENNANSVKLEGLVNTDGKALLVWDNIEAGATYEIRQDGIVVGTVGVNRWTSPEALIKETKYTVTATLTSGQRGNPSNTVSLQPLKSKPVLSPALSMIEVTQTPSKATGVLSWTAVGWAEEYEVFDADTGQSIWTGVNRKMSVSASIGEAKNFFVVAKNNIGTSPQSNIVSLVGPLPGAPTLTSHAVITDGSTGRKITYQWNRMPGAVKHDVYINNRVVAAGDTGLSYTTTFPWNTGIYNVKVVPLSANGTAGVESNILVWNSAIAPPGIPPLTFVGVRSSTGLDGQAKWTSVAQATSYDLEYKTVGKPAVKLSLGPALTYTRSIPVGDTMEVRVRANGPAGSSDWSPWASLKHEFQIINITGGWQEQLFRGNVLCQSGTRPSWRYSVDPGTGIYSAPSSWLGGDGVRLDLTSDIEWNSSGALRIEGKCISTENPDLTSLTWRKEFGSAVKHAKAPTGLATRLSKDRWVATGGGGGNIEFTTEIYASSPSAASNMCPYGTVVKTIFEYRGANGYLERYETWENHGTRTDVLPLRENGRGNIKYTSSCVNLNTGKEGPTSILTHTPVATIDNPTRVSITKGYRKVDFNATCMRGTFPEFKYNINTTTIKANMDYDSITGTGTQYYNRDWGTGKVTIWAICVSPTGSMSGTPISSSVNIP